MKSPLAAAALLALGACSSPPRDDAPAAAPSGAPTTAAAAPADPEVFASPRAAFEAAIAGKPLVVGVGEAHTQKDGAATATTAKRFTEEVLPALENRASDLLVELMLPPTGCQKKTDEARSAQAPVTEKQSESNQSDYVKMGDAARKIGVVPDLLRPSCDDLAAVGAAGDDAVVRSLELIKRLAVAQTKALLAREGRKPGSMIVLYGGALHNDRETTPERRAWAYGPEVAALVDGRYVEVDVFAADAIRDDETWRKLPWVARYDKAKLGDKTTLFRLRPDAFVIVLPRRSLVRDGGSAPKPP